MTPKSRKSVQFAPPAEMVGEDDNEPVSFIDEVMTSSLVKEPTPHHDWVSYFGTDTAFGPDLYPLQPDAKLFVVTGEFTKLNPARMTAGELIDAKGKLAAPVMYRVA